MRPRVIGYSRADAAAFDHAPARRLERRVDVLGSGFGFVHGVFIELPVKAWCRRDCFSASSAASFALVDGGEALRSRPKER